MSRKLIGRPRRAAVVFGNAIASERTMVYALAVLFRWPPPYMAMARPPHTRPVLSVAAVRSQGNCLLNSLLVRARLL